MEWKGRFEHGRPRLLVSVQKRVGESWLVIERWSPHIKFEENEVLCVKSTLGIKCVKIGHVCAQQYV